MRAIRVGLCAAAIAATGVAVAACGAASPVGAPAKPAAKPVASSTAKAPINAIEAAYTSTTGAGTAKISVDASLVAAQGMNFSISANGSMDFAHKTGDMTTSIMGMDLEVRFIDGVEYIHAPTQLLGKDGGKPWVKLDLNEVAKQKLGQSLDQLTSGTPTDPSQMLSYLRGMGSVTDKGPDTVDGVQTEHYLAEMNVSELARNEHLTADQTAQIQKVLGEGQVPMNLWIDGQNRLRQLKYAQNMDLGAMTGQTTGPGAGSVALEETLKLSDFGVPVNVTAPPADQTEDALAALQSGGK
ncbi:MAG TPA: hypothetical protein VGJ45_33860 [Pseudonocardiaceae bacterium]